MCAHVPQAGRAREGKGGEGRGRRSHRVRTDVVLIALRREMPKGLGGCPLGHTASQHSQTTKTTATTPIVTSLDIVVRH